MWRGNASRQWLVKIVQCFCKPRRQVLICLKDPLTADIFCAVWHVVMWWPCRLHSWSCPQNRKMRHLTSVSRLALHCLNEVKRSMTCWKKTASWKMAKSFVFCCSICYSCCCVGTKGVRKGLGLGLKPPPWICYVTKTSLLMQRSLCMFSYIFCLFDVNLTQKPQNDFAWKFQGTL